MCFQRLHLCRRLGREELWERPEHSVSFVTAFIAGRITRFGNLLKSSTGSVMTILVWAMVVITRKGKLRNLEPRDAIVVRLLLLSFAGTLRTRSESATLWRTSLHTPKTDCSEYCSDRMRSRIHSATTK